MFTDTVNKKIETIPLLFRKPDNQLYPSDNYPDFEYWLSTNIKEEEIKSDRIYLGICWTSFYKTCSYGENKTMLSLLQNFIDTLDASKKYFTVVQWDNGILNDISRLDIKVFSMAGGDRKDYGLPLICQPHKFKFENTRNIRCSFVGRITNPIRQKIVDLYSGEKDYYISIKNHSLHEYCEVLSKSVLGLCPEGYGINSFRIQECLEYGAIPVLVSSEVLPMHKLSFYDYGIWINSSNVNEIDRILESIPEESIIYKQSMLKEVFDNYFTFESCKRLILENL